MNRTTTRCALVLSTLGIAMSLPKARTACAAPPQSAAQSPSGAGRAAKLIVLRAAAGIADADLDKMAAALRAMDGVIRTGTHPAEECVSIVAEVDSPVTIDRAVHLLELAGYRAVETDDATTDRIAAAMRPAGQHASGANGCTAATNDAARANNEKPAEMIDLHGSLDSLRTLFNSQKDRPRIVALLSPL